MLPLGRRGNHSLERAIGELAIAHEKVAEAHAFKATSLKADALQAPYPGLAEDDRREGASLKVGSLTAKAIEVHMREPASGELQLTEESRFDVLAERLHIRNRHIR
jgi:hypothetical protein